MECRVDFLHRDIGANAAFHMRLDTEIKDALDFGIKHFSRRPKTRNAIAHHAAQLRMVIEHCDFVPHLCKLVGACKAGGTAADDCNLLAGRCWRLWIVKLVGDCIIPKEMFNRVDADSVFHLIAIAARFAWGRADSTHHRRERVGFSQPAEGVFLPSHPCRRFFDATDDVQVASDVLAGRATALAGRSALDVGRALMAMVCVKDLFLPGARCVVAIAVAPEAYRLCFGLFSMARHCRLSFSSMRWMTIPRRMLGSFPGSKPNRGADQLMYAANHAHVESIIGQHLGKLRLAYGADRCHEIHTMFIHYALQCFHTRQRTLYA